jgi:hypothetical protein
MKASRDRFANLLHRPTELAHRYHTMISTWSGDASLVSTVARGGVLRAADRATTSSATLTPTIRNWRKPSATTWFGQAGAALVRRTKPSEGTARQMQLRRTWMHHQVRRT